MDHQGMKKWLIPICLLWTAAQAGTAYRWVDENGQVNYSDRPAPGAVQIELTAGRRSVPPGHSMPPPPTAAVQGSGAAVYDVFTVIQPAPQEILWGTGGAVGVALRVTPALQPDHRLGLYLDGKLVGLDTRATRLELNDVHRGEHTLQAVILDGQRKEVLRSPAVTFFVQQTSIHYPQNPRRVRPGS